jgi:hypothetical protein
MTATGGAFNELNRGRGIGTVGKRSSLLPLAVSGQARRPEAYGAAVVETAAVAEGAK